MTNSTFISQSDKRIHLGFNELLSDKLQNLYNLRVRVKIQLTFIVQKDVCRKQKETVTSQTTEKEPKTV